MMEKRLTFRERVLESLIRFRVLLWFLGVTTGVGGGQYLYFDSAPPVQACACSDEHKELRDLLIEIRALIVAGKE